jgi:formamidopyrimidine-DNA glycosylase
MPELPEVETVRLGLSPLMHNNTIQDMIVNRHDMRGGIPADMPQHFKDAKVIGKLMRRGKYIIVPCDNNYAMILHLGMSGRIAIFTPNKPYKFQKHDHVIWHMKCGSKIIMNDSRRFGMVYYESLENWQDQKPFHQMGAEPLDDKWDGSVLFETLKNKKKRSIKSALLDQKVVAGIGNIYACEALYRSHIHPERSVDSMSKEQCSLLTTHIKNVLNEAIVAGGSSLRDHKLTDGSMAYFQNHFDVYDREGETCAQCENQQANPCIERIVQNGRSSFFCSNTQK